jgi:hypothetical protein
LAKERLLLVEIPLLFLFLFCFVLKPDGLLLFSTAKKVNKNAAAKDKKLKIVFVSLKSSKLLPLVVRQGRFFYASLCRFSLRFFSKAERWLRLFVLI